MSRTVDTSYFDLPAFREKYLSANGDNAMKFYVEGVKCGRCVQKIESLENQIPGIQALRVNLGTHQLEVEMKDAHSSIGAVAQAIEDLGFHLRPIENENDLAMFTKIDDRREMRRLGVAAVCASNIMMFSFATYFGAEGSLGDFFRLLSFLVYLPVVTYVAQPFYVGFWNSLQKRTLSIDGPMAIASGLGFLFSTVNLVRGVGSVYFDSLSGFLFLILLSRFVQKRLQRSFLSADGNLLIDGMTKARKFLPTGALLWAPSESLQLKDHILVKQGEVIPADGILITEHAMVDASCITGESHPVVKRSAMQIQAGTVLLSQEAVIEVSATAEKSEFGALLNRVLQNTSKKTEMQNLSDRYSQILLLVVFAAAILNLLLTWTASPESAMERSLALIILACPCAMAFGTPLALAFSMKKAFQQGFLIKSGDVFEKILKVQNVFLDKTGTLTGKKMRVIQTVPEKISTREAEITLGLEMNSEHPIAQALRLYVSDQVATPAKIELATEVLGVGIEGEFEGKKYALRSSQAITGKRSVALFEEEVPQIHFILEDRLQAPALKLVGKLKEKGLQVSILSGDSASEVAKICKELGLSQDRCFANGK